MAKCTITFEDGADGDTKLSVEFDPPINNPMHGHKPTAAQELGWDFAQALLASMEKD